MQHDSVPGVVTPEAVRLDFEPASVGTRMVAFVIDLTAITTLFLVLTFSGAIAVGAVGPVLPEWVAVVAVLLLTFGIFWGYPVAFESLWRGRTPGKAALGLRVVTAEGAPVRFRQAAIRAVFGLIDFFLFLGVVAVVTVLATARSQRLGDLVAGTIVVRERTGAGRPMVRRFAVPAGAEAYAATIDPAGVRAEDYQAVREFLVRAPQLAPVTRADLARRLAVPLAARVGHAPPAGVAPELFLGCLAARYQQRGATGEGLRVGPLMGGVAATPQTAAVPVQPSAPPTPAVPSDFVPPT